MPAPRLPSRITAAVGRAANFVRRSVREVARGTKRLFLPPICAGCERDIRGASDSSLCSVCHGAFAQHYESVCPRCSAPAAKESIRPTGCIHCEAISYRFSRIVSLGVYQGLLQSHILKMKEPAGEGLSLAAGQLLGRKILAAGWSTTPQVIVVPPMFWLRRLRGETHAAALLAEGVSQTLKLPILSDVLWLTRNVPRQATLPRTRRRHNLRRAIAVSRAYDLSGARVLLIDDVLTTAATANACARALLSAGAESVDVAVIARGIGAT